MVNSVIQAVQLAMRMAEVEKQCIFNISFSEGAFIASE